MAPQRVWRRARFRFFIIRESSSTSNRAVKSSSPRFPATTVPCCPLFPCRRCPMSEVPQFIAGVWEVFSDAQWADCCAWGDTGDSIVITNVSACQYSAAFYFIVYIFSSFCRLKNFLKKFYRNILTTIAFILSCSN